MIVHILKGCAVIFVCAGCLAIGGALHARWTIWNSPVNRALRRHGRKPFDTMQRAYGDWPHQRGLP